MSRAWIGYGLLGGILAFATTLAANVTVLVCRPADLCRVGPLVIPLSMLGGLAIFLCLAAGAGFATGRSVGSVPDATLAGLLVGTLGGCALLSLTLFMPPSAIGFRNSARYARMAARSVAAARRHHLVF
jgi:hypothetical protein